MYARLEELDARILEVKAERSGDPEDRRRADEARAQLAPLPGVEELLNGWMAGDGLYPEAAAMLTDPPVRPPQRVRPGAEVRRLSENRAAGPQPKRDSTTAAGLYARRE